MIPRCSAAGAVHWKEGKKIFSPSQVLAGLVLPVILVFLIPPLLVLLAGVQELITVVMLVMRFAQLMNIVDQNFVSLISRSLTSG